MFILILGGFQQILSNLGFFAFVFSAKQNQWSIKIHEINYAHSTNK
jgi:hypothetical protein